VRIPAIERERWWSERGTLALTGTWITDRGRWRRIDARRDDPRDFDQAEHDVDWIIDYSKGGEASSGK
jgi:hypothetical protein